MFLRGGTASRSVEKNVAAVIECASSSAADERLDTPGSKPCTTSNAPSDSALARFARSPIGSATRSDSEVGQRGADRNDVADHSPLQRPSALEQVGGPRRGRDDRDGVSAAPQRCRDAARRARSRRAAATRRTASRDRCEESRPGDSSLARSQVESPHGRRHDSGAGERAAQGHRADHDRRRRGRSVRAPAGKLDRPLPLWPLEEQALLRHDAQGSGLRGRRHRAARFRSADARATRERPPEGDRPLPLALHARPSRPSPSSRP